jgi:hypothetical protein
LAGYNFLLGTRHLARLLRASSKRLVRAARARSKCWRESASKPGGTILTSSPRQRP